MNRDFKFFDVGTDLVVTGTNPELADISNPRGEIFGFRPWIRASNLHGDTRVLYLPVRAVESAAVDSARPLADALQRRLDNLGKLPVNFDSWVEGRPIYASEAYVEYGAADDLALERLED